MISLLLHTKWHCCPPACFPRRAEAQAEFCPRHAQQWALGTTNELLVSALIRASHCRAALQAAMPPPSGCWARRGPLNFCPPCLDRRSALAPAAGPHLRSRGVHSAGNSSKRLDMGIRVLQMGCSAAGPAELRHNNHSLPLQKLLLTERYVRKEKSKP